MVFNFVTRRDAHICVANSGVADWEWSGSASAEGFADYLWEHYDRIDTESEDFDAALRGYLIQVGEDPRDYDL